MNWLNEPPRWKLEPAALEVVTADRTDFWRETHYGFVRDDGHFFYQEVAGDFSVEVGIVGKYQHLYDQAGLMVRLDERNWIKAGVEFTDGLPHLSAVVTRDFSDWSVLPLPHSPPKVWLRLTRHGSAVRVQYSFEGSRWALLRLAYLPDAPVVQAGMMCCSPQRSGFEVRFEGFRVGEAVVRELHE
ncbi:MAG: DUF1349 domain-containing protein [Meiothermus sp.]|nr:DUF1349 domain-containing protein [Meiothermus sp.]